MTTRSFRLTLVLLGCLVAALLTLSSAHSQTYIESRKNYLDENGKRQGEWIITARMVRDSSRAPDQIVMQGLYKDSKPIGTWVTFNKDGTRSESGYDENSDTVIARRFTADTNALIEETRYVNNMHDGVAKKYYNDGTLWTEMTWKDGELSGPCKTYYPSGKLYEEGFWDHTHWNGEYKIYNENGSQKRTEQKNWIISASDPIPE